MLGTHQPNQGCEVSTTMYSPFSQILSDFLVNEEGFLSTSYTNILKKYYPQEFAENLYVFHGTIINLIANIAYNDDMSRRDSRGMFRDEMYRVIDAGRFSSVAYSSINADGAYESKKPSDPELTELQKIIIVSNRVRSAEYRRPSDGSVRDPLQVGHQYHRASDMYIGGPEIAHKDLAKELIDAVYYSEELLTNVEIESFTGALNHVAKASIGNQLLLICEDPRELRTSSWLSPCAHNTEQIRAIRNFGTASALQAFFHKEDVSGYDGHTTLTELFETCTD